MKIRHLLVVAAAAAMVADASAFEWEPAIQQPNPSLEITQAYQLEATRFITDVAGVVNTDVMPKWIDEDGNEISAVNCIYDPSWAPGEFTYSFNFSEFKENGEYILCFPEGMLVNGAGEPSDRIETPYTVEVPELAGAMFDDFEVLSVSPDFSVPQAIWTNQVVTINTNHNEAIGFASLQIIDDTTGEGIVFSNNMTTGRTLSDSSAVSWEVVGTYKFLEDHQYTAEFVLYNGLNDYTDAGMTPVVARQKYTFTGRVEGYKYSSVKLLSITPEPYSLVISDPSQAVFTYEFSGPVNVYRADSPQGLFGVTVFPESCLSSNEDKTVWTLDLSDDDYVKSVDVELAISVYARDLDGYQLKGDFGEEDQSCFTASWQCDLGAKPIVVVSPASGASIDCLSEVVVKSADGEPMTWTWNGEAKVIGETGEVLGMLVYDQPENEEDASAVEFRFTRWMDDSWNVFPIEIVKAGSYSIVFDAGCFVFGDQFTAVNSRSVTSTFSVTGALDDTPVVDPQEALKYVSVTPEVGSTVDFIDEILIVYGEPVDCDEFEINVYSVDQTLVTSGIARMDFSEPTMVVVELNEPVENPGRYDVVIPARKIINGDYYESEGAEGLCNPEYHLYYIIEGSVDPGVDPAEQEVFIYDRVSPESGSTVSSLEKINLWYPDIVDTMGKDAMIYNKADHSLVTTAQVVYDWDDLYMINVELEDAVTEAGEYEVVIPARAICTSEFFESDGKKGICNPEIRLSYTVDPSATAVEAVSAAAAVDVYDVQGRRVLRNASAADIKTLAKGIYVVGGRKVVVR